MPLLFVRQDITKMQVDAIVNAANRTLLGGGGVDGAIHRAAGRALLAECVRLGGCAVGEAKRTGGYNLPCKYVIHTVGPVWHGGKKKEPELLASCYRNALEIAAQSDCESVAFPLISAGVFGYPKDQAIQVAVQTIRAFLQTHEMTVYLVLFDRASVQAAGARFGDVAQYIDDHTVLQIHRRFARRGNRPEADEMPDAFMGAAVNTDRRYDAADLHIPNPPASMPKAAMPDAPFEDTAQAKKTAEPTLEEMLGMLDEGFAQMLFRKIDEKGMTDAACYKRANIDRKHFSKIRSNPQYRPKKSTALAFAVALELPLSETQELLAKAGYALSHSSKFDVIVEYFILHGIYDVMEINQALFSFDQTLLGA